MNTNSNKQTKSKTDTNLNCTRTQQHFKVINTLVRRHSWLAGARHSDWPNNQEVDNGRLLSLGMRGKFTHGLIYKGTVNWKSCVDEFGNSRNECFLWDT